MKEKVGRKEVRVARVCTRVCVDIEYTNLTASNFMMGKLHF